MDGAFSPSQAVRLFGLRSTPTMTANLRLPLRWADARRSRLGLGKPLNANRTAMTATQGLSGEQIRLLLGFLTERCGMNEDRAHECLKAFLVTKAADSKFLQQAEMADLADF